MEGEWIDLPTASVDGVLCRWGYMLMLDPEAALRETRRVLRPGGRVALAAWAPPEHQPADDAGAQDAAGPGPHRAAEPDEPGPFAFASPAGSRSCSTRRASTTSLVEALDMHFHYPSRDDVFETFVDLSPTGSATLRALSPADHTRFRDTLDERIEPFVRDDGGVELPGRTLVAAACA